MTVEDNPGKKKYGSSDYEKAVERIVGKYETDEFKEWYFFVAYKIGLDEFLKIEEKADKGKTPGRLFSFLAKEKLDELADSSSDSFDNQEEGAVDEEKAP